MLLRAEKKRRAALVQGLKFYWRVEKTDGTAAEQFDENGRENRLGDYAQVLSKPSVDPYSGSIVLTGIRKATWIPAEDRIEDAYSVRLEEGDEGLVLYRKTYNAAGSMGAGGSYVCYVLGRRFKNGAGDPVELCWYFCPPLASQFPGGITQSTDPLHETAFDLWINARGYM